MGDVERGGHFTAALPRLYEARSRVINTPPPHCRLSRNDEKSGPGGATAVEERSMAMGQKSAEGSMKVERVILGKVAGFLQSGAKRRRENPRQAKGHLIITEVSPP